MTAKPIADPALEEALETMHAALDAVRQSISRELASIPPPVPACDVNFNRLLEERARVVDALQALARLGAAAPDRETVLAFCRAASGLDAQSKAVVEARLASGAPTPEDESDRPTDDMSAGIRATANFPGFPPARK